MTDLTRISLSRKEVSKLRNLNILDEIGIRDLKIKKCFEVYKKKDPSLSRTNIIKKISQETGIGFWTVKKVCDGQKYKKKPLNNPVIEV